MTESTLVSGSRNSSASELSATAHRAAGGLRSLGIGADDTVAALLRNDFAFFEAMQAAQLAGAYFVPINWHLTAAEVAYIIHDAGAHAVVVHADLLPVVREAINETTIVLVVPTPPEIAQAYALEESRCAVPSAETDWYQWLATFDPLPPAEYGSGAIMLYTSGTTGHPKGVRREALSGEANARYLESVRIAFDLRDQARVTMTGPLYHAAPLGYARAALRHHCLIHLMPRFDPVSLLRTIAEQRITHMHVVPIMFVRLLRLRAGVRNAHDLSSLECVLHGAAPCPPDVKRQMIEWWGPVIREYYGTTEASVGCAVDSGEWLSRPGTVGRPLPGVRLAILDKDGQRLPPDIVGEIHYRQETAPDFDYHKRSVERREIERLGMLSNGDLGYVDADGFVYVCDRKRDMIISGGVNIYSAEVEAALMSHPQVHDCAVFGVPDEEFGETVLAAIEPMAGSALSADTLRVHLQQRLARFKWPRTFEFHDHLPRFDNGKVYKQKLRAPHWADRERNI